MTTRRQNGVQPRKKSRNYQSEDEEKEDASAIDVENEMDDDDDVSHLLMPNNTLKVKDEYVNEYDEACAKLQLNSVPKELPCRDKEQKRISDYVTQGVQNKGSSSSLYISGMPGTGKTVTTLEVIRKLLEKQRGRGPHARFEFIHINAMSLTNPNTVYTILAEKIIGRRMNPLSAALFLDEFFKKKDKLQIVQRHMTGKAAQSNKKSQ